MLNTELTPLLEQLKSKLLAKNYTVTTAESCTGGLLAGYLTSLPGSSNYFTTGIVSYSNNAKINILKVPSDIIAKFGAVSPQTAEAMALGAQKLSGSDVAISITGIAGPGGSTSTKPVGMVCFGLSATDTVTSYTHQFSGNRSEIRQLACKQALQIILDYLEAL